jgi:putative RNA 2'-phosphotransferase
MAKDLLTAKDLVRLSRLMSLVLRHKPEELKLKLDSSGWVTIEALLQGLKLKGWYITTDTIMQVVEENDKKRFETKEFGKYIRASQGHSVEVELGYVNTEPPEYLYHGTATTNLQSIFSKGLVPGKRQHVHLSSSVETATKVGSRHGKPIVLKIPAKALFDAGVVFHHTPNDVWLVSHIPAMAIKLQDREKWWDEFIQEEVKT